MTSFDPTAELQDAWPDLPEALKGVVREKWESLADRIAAYDDDESREDVHPLNEFTLPLASMAFDAGFQHDSQGKEFIKAAMDAADIPEDQRSAVALTFAAQLHTAQP